MQVAATDGCVGHTQEDVILQMEVRGSNQGSMFGFYLAITIVIMQHYAWQAVAATLTRGHQRLGTFKGVLKTAHWFLWWLSATAVALKAARLGGCSLVARTLSVMHGLGISLTPTCFLPSHCSAFIFASGWSLAATVGVPASS